MIVRILAEGQWRIDDTVVADLNRLDDKVEDAVRTGNEAELESALHALLEEVRNQGEAVPDDELLPVPGARFAELPVGAIRPNPRQPRRVFDADALAADGTLRGTYGATDGTVVVIRPDGYVWSRTSRIGAVVSA